MKRILKWLGIVLGGSVGLILLAFVVVYAVSCNRINRTHTVNAAFIPIPNDAETIAWGKHLCTLAGLRRLSRGRFGGQIITG